MNELTRYERWAWLKEHHGMSGYTLPWDRMSTPSHEWFNNYTMVHNTDIPLNIPKTKDEIKNEIQTFHQVLTMLYESTKDEHIRESIIETLKYKNTWMSKIDFKIN
jgi:hypothetical protein